MDECYPAHHSWFSAILGFSLFMNWVTYCLGCLAFVYPAHWIATAAISWLPAWFRVAFLGHRWAMLRLNFQGVMAATFPPQVTGSFQPGMRSAEMAPLWGSVIAAFALGALAFWLGRRQRGLAGLLITLLGTAGLVRVFGRALMRNRWEEISWGAGALFLLLLGSGIYCLLDAAGPRTIAGRLATVLFAWALPVALLFFLPGRRMAVGFELVVPGLAIGVLLSLVPTKHLGIRHCEYGWKRILAGVICTFVLAATLTAANARRMRQEEQNQRLARIPAPVQADAPFEMQFFQKGVNFTAEGPAWYGGRQAHEMLRELPRLGVNAIALVPYGFSRTGDAEVRFGNAAERDEDIELLSAAAHEIGVKVLLKPQLWSSTGFPGDLELSGDEQRRRWFASYTRFIEHYARLARRSHADMFCVGVEFVKLARYEQDWRAVIARVRQLYPGPLVYAANSGHEFESIRFWDALDYIGLDNYYPLPPDLNLEGIAAKIEKVQETFGKPVIFTEAGFSSFAGGCRQPWAEPGGPLDLDEQARCYEALFQAFYHKPWFHGVYWWKVGTNGYGGPHDGSHTPWGKPAMDVVARWYRQNLRR